MHSRIYQVSEKPIKEENLIEECRYEDDFVGSTADYVSKQVYESDIESDLEWLQTATKGIKIDTKTKTITITSKKEYFETKHEKFKELAEQLSYISLDDFISDKRYFDVHNLKRAYDEKHAFYIDDNDECTGITSMDNWVRSAEENKTYYVGNIFDYHF